MEKKFKIDEFKSLYTFYYSGLNVRSTDFNANIGRPNQKNKNFFNKHKNFKNINQTQNFWAQESNLKLVSNFGYATFVKNRLEVYKYLKSKTYKLDHWLWQYGTTTFLNSKKLLKKT